MCTCSRYLSRPGFLKLFFPCFFLVYWQQPAFLEHMKNKCKKKYVCVCCGNKYDAESALNKHYRRMGDYHNDKCPLCPGVTFKTWNEHKQHVYRLKAKNIAQFFNDVVCKTTPFFQLARGQVSDSVQTLPGAF